jgi:hypothetical protein
MLLLIRLVLGPVLSQFQTVGLSHIRNIVHGFSQAGIEGLLAGLLTLNLKPTLHGLSNRFNGGRLKDLSLSQGTDHALTLRALGLGMVSFYQVFLDKPFGHGLSIGVVRIGIQAGLDGFHLLHPDIRYHGQGFLSHCHKAGLRRDLNRIRGRS